MSHAGTPTAGPWCPRGCRSGCEGLLAGPGEAQDLVALELGEAVDDGRRQNQHGLPLGLQSAALLDRVPLLLAP